MWRGHVFNKVESCVYEWTRLLLCKRDCVSKKDIKTQRYTQINRISTTIELP